VGRSALAQVLGTAEAKARNGAAGAVEEDARLTVSRPVGARVVYFPGNALGGSSGNTG